MKVIMDTNLYKNIHVFQDIDAIEDSETHFFNHMMSKMLAWIWCLNWFEESRGLCSYTSFLKLLCLINELWTQIVARGMNYNLVTRLFKIWNSGNKLMGQNEWNIWKNFYLAGAPLDCKQSIGKVVLYCDQYVNNARRTMHASFTRCISMCMLHAITL